MTRFLNQMIKSHVFALLCAISIVGCGERRGNIVKATEVVGVAEDNQKRAQIGLRKIADEWVLVRAEADFDDWALEPKSRLLKRVFKDAKGLIVEEEDYHYSGLKFKDHEGEQAEFLSVNYNYTMNEIRVSYVGENEAVSSRLAPYGVRSADIEGALKQVKDIVTQWQTATPTIER